MHRSVRLLATRGKANHKVGRSTVSAGQDRYRLQTTAGVVRAGLSGDSVWHAFRLPEVPEIEDGHSYRIFYQLSAREGSSVFRSGCDLRNGGT